MQTNMDNEQLTHMIARAPLTLSRGHALYRYITAKLAEHGWLSKDEDNEDLRHEIIRNMMDLCSADNSQRFILETLADDETHVSMARWISTLFLGRNPAPKDRGLLSFTDGVIKFFHDLCWEYFSRVPTAIVGSQVVATGGQSSYTQAIRHTRTFPLLRLPAELRNMVYREALVVPGGSLVRTFAPPALLRANKQLRDEAIPIFYGQNHFEITIKRSPQDEDRVGGRGLPNVDMWVWRRFLHMWDDFNCFGSNCLRYIMHIKLIYQLSMDEGYSFGEGEFDRRLGFRFSSNPFEEDHDRNHGTTAPDSRGQDSQSDLEMEETEGGDHDEASSGDEDDGEVTQVPKEDSDPVGVFELNRGTVNWRSRREAHFFLFNRMCEYGTDGMWEVYPMRRLAQMLWLCARDCPLSSRNIDLICEDLPYWMDTIGSYTRHESADFDNLDNDDD